MRKKLFILSLTILGLTLLCGCKKNSNVSVGEIKKCEVALITDEGTVEDGYRNEMAWNGLKRYAQENNIHAEYFIPDNVTKESYLSSIKTAVKSGAKVIVCPSALLEEAVYDAQKEYKDVNFILLEGEPHNADYSDIVIGDNTECISFQEEEAGFLAGYAAVRDGFTYLGFLGGMADDSVIRYGYGFVQGADYAAIEMGIKIYVAYVYSNTFSEDINVQNMAGNWYLNGCEAIFTCGGGSLNHSVIRAAEEYKKNCILAEPALNHMSSSIVFTCVNNIEDAVYDAVGSYYTNTFLGGVNKKLSLTEDGLGIDMSSAHFTQFSDVEYEAICSILKKNEVKPYSGNDMKNTDDLDLVNTTIVYAEY